MAIVEPLTAENAGAVGPLIEQWRSGMLIAGTNDQTDAQYLGLLAHCPDLMRTVLDHYAVLFRDGQVPARLKELLRIRAADALGCNPY